MLVNRREFIRTTIATVTLAAVAGTGIFEIAAKVQSNQNAAKQQALQLPAQSSISSSSSLGSQTSSQPSSAAPAGYFLAAPLSSLSGKSYAYFNHPAYGESMLLSLNGQWKAFSATCTHRPCQVEYLSSEIYCPCHGAAFSPSNGAVLRGPAQVALGEYGVLVQGGSVYVSESRV